MARGVRASGGVAHRIEVGAGGAAIGGRSAGGGTTIIGGRTLPEADDLWQPADPATQGLDPAALDRHLGLCEGTGADACLVVHRGRIVQEWYSDRYHEPIGAMSTTKSITGLLAAMLIERGMPGGLDTPVCTYVTEWCEGIRGRVTLGRDLAAPVADPRGGGR